MEAVSPTAPELLSLAHHLNSSHHLQSSLHIILHHASLHLHLEELYQSTYHLHPFLHQHSQEDGSLQSAVGRTGHSPTPLASAPVPPALPGTAGRYPPYTDERSGGRWERGGQVPPVSALPPALLGRTVIVSAPPALPGTAGRYSPYTVGNVVAVGNVMAVGNVVVDGGAEDANICIIVQ